MKPFCINGVYFLEAGTSTHARTHTLQQDCMLSPQKEIDELIDGDIGFQRKQRVGSVACVRSVLFY